MLSLVLVYNLFPVCSFFGVDDIVLLLVFLLFEYRNKTFAVRRWGKKYVLWIFISRKLLGGSI